MVKPKYYNLKLAVKMCKIGNELQNSLNKIKNIHATSTSSVTIQEQTNVNDIQQNKNAYVTDKGITEDKDNKNNPL